MSQLKSDCDQVSTRIYIVAPGITADMCERCYLRTIDTREMTELERQRKHLTHAQYTAIQPHRMNVRKGQPVRFKPEYQDAGDDKIVFIAVEDSDGERVMVEAQLGLPINPRQVVTLNMIAKETD